MVDEDGPAGAPEGIPVGIPGSGGPAKEDPGGDVPKKEFEAPEAAEKGFTDNPVEGMF